MTSRSIRFTATDSAGLKSAPLVTTYEIVDAPSTGWTTFTATQPSGSGSAFTGTGTRIIYVSASGNDVNPGTAALPKKTLTAGKALLRNGSPDWLLLRKGDTWTNEQFGLVGGGGKSATEPRVIGSYDPSQPGVVDPAIAGGRRPLVITSSSVDRGVGQSNYTAVVGLEFKPSTNGVGSGFYWNGTHNWVLLENCYFHGFRVNTCEWGTNTFIMRRCIVADAVGDNHSQGIYIDHCADPQFIECIFDNNCKPNSIFGRNVYIEQTCGKATIAGLISTRSGSEGLQMRSGGTLTNSFFAKNSAGFQIGMHKSDAPSIVVNEANCTNNVVVESLDISSSDPRGGGVYVLYAKSTGAGIHINNNIIAHLLSPPPRYNSAGIDIDSDCADVDCSKNIIFKWPGEYGAFLDNGLRTIKTPNDIDIQGTNNNPNGTAPHEPFPAPNRTPGSYAGTLGLSATTDAFIAAARSLSKDAWNDAYTANGINTYIRAGFGL